MKAQMKVADRSGAAVALIIGGDEAEAGVVTVRPLRRREGETAEQRKIARAEVIDEVKRTL
jgi:histidyl-tRNA synthetase